MIRYILLAFCVMLSSAVKAQSDSIVFSDSTVIHYSLKLASGNRMPAFQLNLMSVAVAGSYNFYNGAYIASEARTSLKFKGMDMVNAEIYIPVVSVKKYISSGKMLLREKTVNGGKWRYFISFNGISQNTNFGVNLGVQRYNSPDWYGNMLPQLYPTINNFHIMSMNGYEFGLGLHTRYGLALSSDGANKFNFVDYKINFKAIYYSARTIVYMGDEIMKGDLPAAVNTYGKDVFPKNFAYQISFQGQAGSTVKEKRSKLLGNYFVLPAFSFKIAYVPILEDNVFLYTASVGLGIAMRPRYYQYYKSEKIDTERIPEAIKPKIKKNKSPNEQSNKSEIKE